ncbi:hypothetical protein HDF15_003305 [Granulicella mallensis]|uniref:Uncharacterized protein n=1 Tax=Granulicella mallensis TaxID=940614 RepID=A0A7W7ZRU9_9BACT|nr:hypothetical protein [Granulicella mallensis]
MSPKRRASVYDASNACKVPVFGNFGLYGG